MKKFLVSILLCLICAISFTACDDLFDGNGTTDGDNEQEPDNTIVKTEVTKEEFEKALLIFNTDNSEDLAGLKLTCEVNIEDEIYDTKTNSQDKYLIDIDKKIMAMSGWAKIVNSSDATTQKTYSTYFWEIDGIKYSYIKENDYPTGAVLNENKNIYDNSDFEDRIWTLDNVGGWMIKNLNLAKNYEELIYDDASGEYSASLKVTDYIDDTYNFTLKFENGKLVVFKVITDEAHAEYKYIYDASVSVPENILNMECTEESN